MDHGRRFAHIMVISNLIFLLLLLLVVYQTGARLPAALTVAAANAIIPVVYLVTRRRKGDF